MAQLPRGAEQLTRQVTEYEDATYEVSGEPDGFGVHREIVFDEATSKWLAPVLTAIEDERIERMEDRSGQLAVIFVGDTRADFDDEYPIDDVLDVFDDDRTEEPEDVTQ